MGLNLLTIYGNMATLLESGVDIRRAVAACVSGGRGKLYDAMMDVQSQISLGESLPNAMAKHPKAFPHADLMLVNVGDEAGRLPQIFKQLNEWYVFRRKLWRGMLAGMIQPALVIHVAAVVIPLPKLITQKISFVTFVAAVLGVLACFYLPIIGMFLLYKTASGKNRLRDVLDGILGRTPIVGGAMRDLAIARYCRGFLAMYEAGIPVQRCCIAAVDMCGNAMVAGWFRGAIKQVKQGDPIYLGFSNSIPYEFRVVWQNGEESGRLAFAVEKLAADYGERAQDGFKRISTWLPRVIYFFIALFIIYAIFSIAMEIAPMYQVQM